MDKVTEQRINLLHPKIREEVRTLINQCNSLLTQHSQVRIIQGYRTFAEQDALFKKRPKVTNAKAGASYHNYGLAFDFAMLVDGTEISWDIKKDWDKDGMADWMEVVRVFANNGYDWGGKFSTITDNPHIEKRFGLTWQQMLKKYNAKDFIQGTEYINI